MRFSVGLNGYFQPIFANEVIIRRTGRPAQIDQIKLRAKFIRAK
jgi:hypothetical protein